MKLLPDAQQKAILARYQLVRARGKAAIISLVKYLSELGIKPIVVHDGDFGVEGAEKFNAPIASAVADPGRVVVLNSCLEDALGYPAPSSDKPYRAFTQTIKWASLDEVPTPWRDAMKKIFAGVFR